ncbi:MAG: DUF4159 domain-containing protein, partial [Planctomycetota bacterium]
MPPARVHLFMRHNGKTEPVIIYFLLFAGVILFASFPPDLHAMGEDSQFKPFLVRYDGPWDQRPTALRTVQRELQLRTSVRVGDEVITGELDNPNFYQHPFAWMTGDSTFEPLPERDIDNLRRYLKFGGMLVIDDGSGEENSDFLRSVQRMVKRIFPAKELQPLPSDHAIYRSYYFLEGPSGLHSISDALQAIHVDDRAAVVFSPNDLSGALERDSNGWVNSPNPQRDDERE